MPSNENKPKWVNIDAINWLRDEASPKPKSGRDFAILMILAIHANKDTGDSYPSKSLIANETGLSDDQVKRGIKSLLECGLIVRGNQQYIDSKIPGNKRPIAYRLNGFQPVHRGSATAGADTHPQHWGSKNDAEKTNRGSKTGPTGGAHTPPKEVIKNLKKEEGARPPSTTQTSPQNTPAPASPPPSHFHVKPAGIPEAWIQDFHEGIEHCHERHPNGNHNHEPCHSCATTKKQIQAILTQRATQQATQEREARRRRRNGKDTCTICDHNGYREQLNPTHTNILQVKCNHTPEDRTQQEAATAWLNAQHPKKESNTAA